MEDKVRGRYNHWGGEEEGGAPTTMNNRYTTSNIQPPAPIPPPMGPKYNFQQKPILTPWGNPIDHTTATKIQWGRPGFLEPIKAGTQNRIPNNITTKHAPDPNHNWTGESKSILCDPKSARTDITTMNPRYPPPRDYYYQAAERTN